MISSTFALGALRWLRADRTAPACVPSQRALAARYVAAAEERLRCARDVSLADVVPAVLLRDAIILLTYAAMAARGERAPDVDPVAALAALHAAPGCPPSGDHAASDGDDVRRVADAIGSRDPLYFDRMDEEALPLVHATLEREARWLRTQIDLRSPANVKGTRYGRQAGVAIVALWLAHAAFAAVFGPRDLALGKPVRASSHQPGTPDPSGLVDGKIADTYGFHTLVSSHEPSWAIIDLQQIADIHEIVVYNRSDVNFDDGLPFALDLSTDGVTYHEVAHRDKSFGDGGFMSPPWRVKVRDHARYVRVRAKRYMALNEVEVF
ncbi:MAG: discoidin domain-containing protein [Polyangiaceae bacterium]